MRAHSKRVIHCGAAALALSLVACASTHALPPSATAAGAKCPELPTGSREATQSEIVHRFYDAFSRRDFPSMACCYDADIEFSDSIFGTLKGKRALAMWSMLVSQADDLKIQAMYVRFDGKDERAHWNARYSFPFLLFDNRVENSVDATFEFKDGKIHRHRDEFDLGRWMHMALWPLGGVVDEGTIRNGVQDTLDRYIEKHAEFQDAKTP